MRHILLAISIFLASICAVEVNAQEYTFKWLENLPESSRTLFEVRDTVAEIPLDSIIAWRIEEIKRSLPSYKYDRFSHTMVAMPLIMNGYRQRKTDKITLQYGVNRFSPVLKESIISPDANVATMPLDTTYEIYSNLRYQYMIAHPEKVKTLSWQLPEFKKLEDVKIKEITDIPTDISPEVPVEVVELKKIHWLHMLDGSVQFSQAYLSPNWYQGGNNNLSLIVNFLWNVKLNEVYHPNLLFENNVQYKLGLYSTPQDECHSYSISEDLFQWNLKGGVKAFKKWFYSFTLQFKTQLLNTYPQNSMTRTASFLSPADLNIGLGMTYNTANRSKTLKFNASIAPISYNLKTCLDSKVSPTQFNIAEGKKTMSEVGSNAELTLDWNLAKNINYRSRMFLFSNYKYFLGDWENTISFSINKFLSTQIYVHLRYDSSSELTDNSWKHWMLKEILSFGFQYKFSTKI